MIATETETREILAKNVGPVGVVVAQLQGVSKNYGEVKALRDVDLAIHAGELVTLLGPNGAGKTTAVKLLLGLARPATGTVSVLGGNPVHPQVRMRIGAMLQVARVPETLRVKEHIDLFSSYYPKPFPIARTLAAAGLEQISNRRVLPMTPRIRSILEQQWAATGKPCDGWIWPGPTKTGHIDHSSLKKQHAKTLKLSGVRPFVLYSLRHTFLTRLGESGYDAWTLARVAGHSSVTISSRYVHPSEDLVLAAMSRLGWAQFWAHRESR